MYIYAPNWKLLEVKEREGMQKNSNWSWLISNPRPFTWNVVIILSLAHQVPCVNKTVYVGIYVCVCYLMRWKQQAQVTHMFRDWFRIWILTILIWNLIRICLGWLRVTYVYWQMLFASLWSIWRGRTSHPTTDFLGCMNIYTEC